MLLLLSALALAQDDATLEDGFQPIEELKNYVQVSTKVTQPAILTPASVSVITRDQIARTGYRSVAEALGQVPGFYVSYDLVQYNVTVRGAFGGARAGSRLLKIMIDGVPVPFAQSETYLLGPEFIPITAVERIEVLRGPASSLYGAGAYAGAINIVTRQDSYEGQVGVGGEVRAGYGALGVDGPMGDGAVQIVGARTNLMLGAAGALEDRSGLGYPDPADYADDPELASWLDVRRNAFGDQTSDLSEDKATPAVLFGRLIQVVGGGRLSVFGIGQLSSRDAEFYDTSVLSHDTRVAVRSLKASAAYERPLAVGLSLTARANLSQGATLEGDQLVLPGEAFAYERDLSYLSGGGALEVRYDLPNLGFVLVGGDAQLDSQDLPAMTSVDLETGDETPLNEPLSAGVSNFAGYAQALYPFTSWLSVSAGGRVDAYSSTPTATGDVTAPDPLSFVQPSGRVALLLDYDDRVALKLIGGTAFKAASPEQLYIANPIPNDIEGDPTIQPQQLTGGEVVLEGYPAKTVIVSASAFANQYRDTIGYQLVQGDQIATSYDANNVGGELGVRVVQPLPFGRLGLQGSLSLQDTHTLADETVEADPFVTGEPGKFFPDNESVPQVMTYARVGLTVDPAHLALVVEHRYVGERTPSQSNLLNCALQDMSNPCYTLPDYHRVDLALSTTTLWADAEHHVGGRGLVRVEDLLDARYLDVGFNGVDVPSVGRSLWLRADLLF